MLSPKFFFRNRTSKTFFYSNSGNVTDKKVCSSLQAKILWSYGKALFGPKVYFLAPNYDLFGPAYETKWQPCLFTLAKANSKVSSARFLHLLT